MERTNLWKDAAKYGAVIALVGIVFNVLVMLRPGFLPSLVSLAIFIWLLFFYTKRRANLYGGGAAGYSYGKCLLFIVCMMLVAGAIDGVYQIAAVKWLFAERYEENIGLTVAMLENTGFYTPQQLEMVADLYRSPVALFFLSILGWVIRGGFFGLFVAAFTKREPDIFADDTHE